jgi:hypothetical protein
MGRNFALLVCLGVVLGVGCKSGSDANPDASTDGPTGVVQGTVYHALTLQPLPGAQVKLGIGSDEVIVTGDAEGKFAVSVPVSSDVKLKAEPTGQEATMKSVAVHEGSTSYVEVFTMPVGKHAKIDATAGGEVEGPLGSSIKLPPQGLAYEDGTTVEGEVDVTLTPMVPQDPKQLAARPGKPQGTNVGGVAKGLSPVVTVAVSLSQGGAKVNLGAGKKAQVKLPVTDSAASAALSLWSFNEGTGKWVEESALVKVATVSGDVYKGEVSHFSYWSADVPMDAMTCLRGCVAAALRGARVVVDGVDHVFRDELSTDGEGCFAVDVMAGGRVRVQALTPDGASAPLGVPAPETPASSNDPASCHDVGTLDVEPTAPANAACPRGRILCGDRCIDPGTDPLHCGVCNNNCGQFMVEETRVFGATCVEGVCGCPPSRPDVCGDRCVNHDNDPEACGSCTREGVCALGQDCVNRTCVERTCPTGTSLCDTCAWESDLWLCAPQCVDITEDPRHCGGCAQGEATDGIDCTGQTDNPEGLSCSEDACACRSGYANCEGEGCVDVQSDFWNCGACFEYCDYQGDACIDGLCGCSQGLTNCGDEFYAYCVDTAYDMNNCGECGTTCSDGVCVEGDCVGAWPACDNPSEIYCAHSGCVDVSSDPHNCAQCGNPCAGAEVCTDGRCFCSAPGTDTCGQNGECVSLLTDAQHCGGCDRRCSVGQRCEQGACTY